MEDIVVRPATAEDLPAIAAIYNHYIETSTATFDTEPKSLEDRRAWFDAHDGAHPVLVAGVGGEVVAWGSLSTYRDRPAWASTAEVALYAKVGHTGRGVGPLVLSELIAAGRAAGLHLLVSQIVGENAPSLTMCERAGFERVGALRQAGRKFGRWLDVVIMQLPLFEEGD